MGQGLYTKLIQIAAQVLRVLPSKIHTSGFTTDLMPNTIVTGASVGTDLYGPAVVQACEEINSRIAKYKNQNKCGKWEEWVMAAWMDCTSLVAYGYYDNWHNIDYDFVTNKGKNFHYFTYGAGAIRVEVNCVTGDITILSADLVVDLGKSINPAIDMGQIEGAFMQGIGYMTTEEIRMSSASGMLLTFGPGDYKVPNISDLPLNMNVRFANHNQGPTSAAFSSKGIGEPPLLLAVGIPSAVRMAVGSYRQDRGFEDEWINLKPPLTPEKVAMVCQNKQI